MFLDHTQLETHTRLDSSEKKTQQRTKIRPLSRIRTRNPINPGAVYLLGILPGHRDRPALLSLVAKYCAFRHKVYTYGIYFFMGIRCTLFWERTEPEILRYLGTEAIRPHNFLLPCLLRILFTVCIFLHLFLYFIRLIFRPPYFTCLFLLSSTVLSVDWIPTLFSYVIYTLQSIFSQILFHLILHTLRRSESIGLANLVHLHRLCLDTHPYPMLNSKSHSKSSKTMRPLD